MYKNHSLLICTDKYPFGNGESFLQTELMFLAQSFGHIIIMPLEKGGSNKRRETPNNIKVIEPPFFSVKNKMELLKKGIFNSSPIGCYFTEFFKNRAFISVNKFRNWFTHLLLTRAQVTYLKSKKISFSDNSVSYFYWGLRWSEVLPFVNINQSNVIVRFHGSDLYDERNNNYIPFRLEQLSKINLAVFVSEMGRDYLVKRYSEYVQATYISRLGTMDFGIGPYNSKKNLHLVSCSNIVALKQLDLLAQSLKHVDFPVKWTHVGDGPLKRKIMDIASEIGSNIEINFKGQLNHDELMLFYRENQVDLFLNTSLSEGVPVSIMEALSFGIPVIATDVGGTREIVDEEVGLLISPKITAQDLANKIKELLKSDNYHNLRQNARKRWESRCQANLLYKEFTNKLLSLIPYQPSISS